MPRTVDTTATTDTMPTMATRKLKPVGKVHPRFTRGVIADVDTRFANARGMWGFIDAFTINGIPYTVEGLKQDLNVYWRVYDANGHPHTTLGAGWFTFVAHPRRLLRENRAALVPAHRRLGIYPLVLLALRAAYKRPLVSDTELSRDNIRAWAKVAALEGPVYIINPRLRRLKAKSVLKSVSVDMPVEDQIRNCWLATEGRLP